MTLGFSTKWPAHMVELANQPNYFIEKIWEGLFRLTSTIDEEQMVEKQFQAYLRTHEYEFNKPWDELIEGRLEAGKIHTIRKGNRWKAGIKIHPVIHNRTKNRFQFAPTRVCTSVQQFELKYTKSSAGEDLIYLEIESQRTPGYMLCLDTYNPEYKTSSFGKIEKLAVNDGFDNVEDFFAYFNKDFKGQIIHWTDLSY